MYTRESDLVRDFAALVCGQTTPWPHMRIAFEFAYQNGRVDVVGTSSASELFSFEAKLIQWREALHQAYRSTSFSHHAYIVLPEKTAKKAAMHSYEFEARRVGLLSVSPSSLEIIIPASCQNPILPWLTGNALEYITKVNFIQFAGGQHAISPAHSTCHSGGVQQEKQFV